MEHSSGGRFVRLKSILYAEPKNYDQIPKLEPDQ